MAKFKMMDMNPMVHELDGESQSEKPDTMVSVSLLWFH